MLGRTDHCLGYHIWHSKYSVPILKDFIIIKHSSSSASHYEILDVPKTASHEEIKKAFFEQSKKVCSAMLTVISMIDRCQLVITVFIVSS